MTQCEFDFNAPQRGIANRPHHRTTTLTTDGATYERVANLRDGEECAVEFCNDIVSSAKGGNSVDHHPIRRVRLLRRQLSGNFRKVKVRSTQGLALNCIIVGDDILGREDACSGHIMVARVPLCARAVCHAADGGKGGGDDEGV